MPSNCSQETLYLLCRERLYLKVILLRVLASLKGVLILDVPSQINPSAERLGFQGYQ